MAVVYRSWSSVLTYSGNPARFLKQHSAVCFQRTADWCQRSYIWHNRSIDGRATRSQSDPSPPVAFFCGYEQREPFSLPALMLMFPCQVFGNLQIKIQLTLTPWLVPPSPLLLLLYALHVWNLRASLPNTGVFVRSLHFLPLAVFFLIVHWREHWLVLHFWN